MKRFRILIVEDNSNYRNLLKETLQKCLPRISVDEAKNGGMAFQKIDTFHPDLIFMDIRLATENGLQLTKRIKAMHPHIVVFVITFYGTPEYQKAAFESGADTFLTKASLSPVELEELLKLAQILSNRLKMPEKMVLN